MTQILSTTMEDFYSKKIPFPYLPPQTLHLTDNSAGFFVLFFLVGNIIDDMAVPKKSREDGDVNHFSVLRAKDLIWLDKMSHLHFSI